MKHFIIKLYSKTQEREDYINHLITAIDQYTAGKRAIEDQVFSPIEDIEWIGNDFDNAYDLDGEIELSVSETKEMPKDHFDILKLYL